MNKGIYCLVFKNPECTIRIGALGDLFFQEGWHIYIGSALGSGGLQRLRRHISLSHLHDKRPKWHVDYLLTDPDFSLRYAVYAVTENRLECEIAHQLNNCWIPRFGCSDCSCVSHLFYRQHINLEEILAAFRHFKLKPVTKTIMNP
jgi:Uri superfamily endonuclease